MAFNYPASLSRSILKNIFSLFFLLSYTGESYSTAQAFTPFTVGWYVDSHNNKLMYAVNQSYEAAYSVQDTQGVVPAAVNYAIENSEIGGSDIVLRRAYHVSHHEGLARLGFDLQVAKDFEKYEANTTLIKTLIAESPESQFAAGWIATLQWASELGLQYASHFNAMEYLASYSDLRQAFGNETEAATRHFINYGIDEGRRVTFDGLEYLAANPGLAQQLGHTDRDAAASHYIQNGQAEHRSTHFDILAYIASYNDLIRNFGTNEREGVMHAINWEFNDGRYITFDAESY